MKKQLLFLLFTCSLFAQNATINNLGTTTIHNQYKGGIGSDKVLLLPLETETPLFSNLRITGRLHVNSSTFKLQYNDGVNWKYLASEDLLNSALSNKFNVPTGLSSEYLRGDGTVGTFPIFFSGDYNSLTNKPVIPTNNNQLVNGAGYLTSIPDQTWSSITGKPSFSIVATTGSYLDLLDKPNIPTTTNQLINNSGFLTSVPSQSFSNLTSKPTTLSGYGITDAYPLTGNPAGYISTIPSQSFASLTGKPTTLSGYGITDAYPLNSNPANYLTSITQAQVNTALGFTPIGIDGARNAITVTNNGFSGNATYNPTTGVLNVPNYSLTVYTGSAQVSSGGNSTYFLTSTGTSTGTPLFNNVTFATPFVNDSNVNYTYGWSYNATTKVLTVNTKSSTAVTVAGVSVLGIPNNVPAGTTVTVLVRGN